MENQHEGLVTADEVRSRVREFIVETFLFGTDSPDFKDETSFLQGGIMDSTGILELIHFVEVTFRIRVTETETVPENLDSLNNLSRFVTRKVAEVRSAAN
jgi:acyl carrier protein